MASLCRPFDPLLNVSVLTPKRAEPSCPAAGGRNSATKKTKKKIKRRTAVVGIFPTRASCIRLVGMVLFEQDDEWQDGRRYFLPESMARIDAVTEPEEVSPALLIAS